MRFKEDAQWTAKKLDEIASFYKGNGLSKEDISSEGNYCILYGQLYTTYTSEIIDDVVSKTKKIPINAFYSLSNDIIIPASGETPEDIAKACCITSDGILIGGDLNVIRTYNHNGGFLSYQLNGKRKGEIARLAQGKSIVHLHNSDIKNIKIFYPLNKNIEVKICNFLFKIDARIQTQKKIIEFKESLIISLSQMFFKNKEKNFFLSEVVKINKGKQINNDLLNAPNQYNFYNGGIGPSGKYHLYNSENCISISEGGNSCGYVNYISSKFWSGGHNYTLTPISSINEKYLYHYLKYSEKSIMSLRVGSGLPNIQKHSIDNFRVFIPKINVQNDIESILSTVGSSIKHEKKILKLYQKQKDYFLNKMFI